jgi:hypothetical protein
MTAAIADTRENALAAAEFTRRRPATRIHGLGAESGSAAYKAGLSGG